MYNDDNFDLRPDEAAALAALPREMDAGDLLESKVIHALREQGYFGVSRARSARGISLAWKIAAAVMLFAGGVATGRYVLASNAPQSASTTAPATEIREARETPSRNDARPVPGNETVIAEREMWL
jgi:hypothetical protein